MFLSFIGFLLFALGVTMLFIRPSLREEDETIERVEFGTKYYDTKSASHPILLWFSNRKSLIIVLFGVLMMFQSVSWFYAKDGFQYRIVSPTGNKYAVFNQGIKFIVPFSKVQEWQKFIDIKTIMEDESSEGIEGIIRGGVPMRFIDQVTANVQVSVRMELPSDEVSFLRLAQEFRVPNNLVNNTLIPTVREQIINTGYMYAAQDYISGSAADFRTTLDEQLKFGGFSVEKKEMQDTTYLNTDIQQDGNRQIKEITTRYEVIKRVDGTGKPIRNPHDITKNNIVVSQVIVDQVDLEKAFKQRLEKQRDISAQKRIEMEMIETAKAAQQRIIAEGERDKAAERVTQEKEQVKALISIETKLKQESTNKDLAIIALETAKINATKTKVEAEAKRVQLQMADGLSEEEKYKLDIQLKQTQAMSEALKQIRLPQTVIMSDGKTGDGNSVLEAILGTMLVDQLKTKKKIMNF